MKKITNNLINLVEWLKPSHKVKFVEELPETIKRRNIYIVGIEDHPWLLAFRCPCGCGKTIQLNLLNDAQPCWHFKLSTKKKIDIHPSIFRIYGCKSHFRIIKGKVSWCQ